MIKNYLKIAFRNLVKNKVFSLINIVGLAIGIVACMLILQYVRFELSYDNFHTNGSKIYRITATENEGIGRESIMVAPPIGPELERNYPEVIEYTRLILPWSGQEATSTLVLNGNEGKTVKHNFKWGFYTDPGFFEMFNFPFILGNAQDALGDVNKIVLSESAARKLFGNDWKKSDQILGQSLEYINEFDRFSLVISGVVADAPENSHFQYDFLASFGTLSTGWGKDYAETWNGHNVYTYLQLAPDLDYQGFLENMNEYVSGNHPDPDFNKTISLQALQDIHLDSHLDGELKANGNLTNVYFLFLTAVLILLIALVNYINLSTAKSVARSSEVGLRKAMGALRHQLIKQFLFESLLVNGFAYVLAVLILFLVSPLYLQLTGREMDFYDGWVWLFIVLLFPITTILSGIYPAFILSGYNPIHALKGKFHPSSNGQQLRKGMVVFQFAVSMTLIIFTIAMYQQLNFMRSNDPGFDKEGVIVVKGPGNRTETWIEHDLQKDSRESNDPFKEIVAGLAGVQKVSLSWAIPGETNSIYPMRLGQAHNHGLIDVLITDNDYAEVYGLKLLAGSFNTEDGHVINEETAKVLGFEDPTLAIGQVFKDDREQTRTINGVVKNYHHQSLKHGIGPLIFSENDPTYKLDSYYSLKVTGNDVVGILSSVEDAYGKVYEFDSFEYFFIDSYFESQHLEDSRFGNIFAIFAGLTIFIACLGLIGLSLHTSIERTKEIGIRKVLGADVFEILGLLIKEISTTLLLSILLAIPISVYLSNSWLDNFAYKTELKWWIFAGGGALIMLIALFSISFQSIKAALMNPVKSLKSE